MDAVDDATRAALIAGGALFEKYAKDADRESAHELITARLEGAAEAASSSALPPPPPGQPPSSASPTPPVRKSAGKPKAPKPGAASKRDPAPAKQEESVGDHLKEAGIGFAKDMLTTEDGRRTVRTVLGALFGKR